MSVSWGDLIVGAWLIGAGVTFWIVNRWPEIRDYNGRMDPITFTAVTMLSLLWPFLVASFLVTRVWRMK